jgi:hypothetical protein
MKRHLVLAGLLAGFAQAVSAAPITPVNLTTIRIDQAGNGSRTIRAWHDTNGNLFPDCNLLNPLANGECGAVANLAGTPVPFAVIADPGPGGLSAVPTYALPAALDAGTQGDVILTESGPASDVVRFNGDHTIIFYQDLLPLAFYGNVELENKESPWTIYVPHAGQPGFGYTSLTPTLAANWLTYAFQYPSASQRILNLVTATESLNFDQSQNLLLNALAKFEDGHLTPACNQMNAFTHQVQAQSGKALTSAEANQLLLAATRTMTAMGCQ